MKISVIRHSIRAYGADKVVLDYLNTLAEKGHTITYWTSKITTHLRISPQITIRKIPIPTIAGTIVFAIAKRFACDLLLVDLAVMAFFTSCRNKKKILYLAQDYDLSYYHPRSLSALFTQFAYHHVLRNPDILTVCVAQGLHEKLQKFNPVNIVTVTNGIPLDFFKPSPQTQPKDVFSILFFARHDRRKGLDIAIAAFEKLKTLNPGGKWEVRVLGNVTVSIPGVRCQNLGFLKTDEELKKALQDTDIFLIPSRSEGLSLLLLQALACGCVIVSTAASSILTPEVNGLVSAIEDSEALAHNLNRALNDDSLRKKLKANARLLAQEYSLEKSCRKFEEILISFTQGTHAPRHL